MGFSRQEYWSGLPSPSSGDLPQPGIKPMSPTLAGGFFTFEPPGKPITNILRCSAHRAPSEMDASGACVFRGIIKCQKGQVIETYGSQIRCNSAMELQGIIGFTKFTEQATRNATDLYETKFRIKLETTTSSFKFLVQLLSCKFIPISSFSFNKQALNSRQDIQDMHHK